MPEPLRFRLSNDELALVDEARRVGVETLEPIARAGDEGRVNRELVRALASHGFLSRLEPENPVVGGGPSALELCLVREGLAGGSTDAETAFALQGLGSYPILSAGSPEIIERFAGPVLRGEAVAAFALTEPGSGSDAGALQLEAVRDGDAYVLTGDKAWISNAPEMDVLTLFARTKPDAGAKGVTAFVVHGESTGLSGDPIELLAGHPV